MHSTIGQCATSPQNVPGVVRECGDAGIFGLIVISAGFNEVGDDGKELEAQVEKALRDLKG